MSTVIEKTSRPPRTFATVLTAWLTDLARVHSLGRREPIVIMEQDFALYADALSDLSVDQLDAAFLRASQVCRFFPNPADVRSQLEQTTTKALALESEVAWQRALDWIDRWFHPDVGVDKRAPSLDPSVRHAIVAAGGFEYLFNTCGEQLQWAKKRFIDSYTNVHELGQVQHLLEDGEAKNILRRLSSGESQNSGQKQLASASKSGSENLTNEEIRALTDKFLKRAPVPMTPEQKTRRLEELRSQAELLRSQYPDQFVHVEVGVEAEAVLAHG